MSWGFNSDRVEVDIFEDYEQWQRARGANQATTAKQFQLLPGYEIDLIRNAGKDEDSWIAFRNRMKSMLYDPLNRALYERMVFADHVRPQFVEVVNDVVSELAPVSLEIAE